MKRLIKRSCEDKRAFLKRAFLPHKVWASMRAALAILPFLLFATACEQSGSARPLGPLSSRQLQTVVRSLAPVDIPSSASDVLAARILRSSAAYSNLLTFFFAFRCSPEDADRIMRRDSSLDNSIKVDPLRVTITDDPSAGTDRPIIVPAQFPAAPVFPDVFYERQDLGDCSVLRIRVKDAPEWFTPHTMKRGIAARCVWGLGQIQVEFYYDSDRQTMFLRFDQLRPE
jgi:hypothetical protein